MSSILTALKKLENKDFHKEEVVVLSRNSSAKHTKRPTAFTSIFAPGPRFWRISVFLMVSAIFGILSLNYIREQKNVLSSENQNSNEVQETILASKTTKKLVDKPPKDIQSPTFYSKSDGGNAKKSSDALGLPAKFPLSETNTGFRESSDVPDLSEKKKDALPVQDKVEKPIPPAGHENLLLQAIAWAKDPADRMAVINGEIVRQGDTLNKIGINEINENDVVLKKDGHTWRLLFKVR